MSTMRPHSGASCVVINTLITPDDTDNYLVTQNKSSIVFQDASFPLDTAATDR